LEKRKSTGPVFKQINPHKETTIVANVSKQTENKSDFTMAMQVLGSPTPVLISYRATCNSIKTLTEDYSKLDAMKG
jgi:hypothetical protein